MLFVAVRLWVSRQAFFSVVNERTGIYKHRDFDSTVFDFPIFHSPAISSDPTRGLTGLSESHALFSNMARFSRRDKQNTTCTKRPCRIPGSLRTTLKSSWRQSRLRASGHDLRRKTESGCRRRILLRRPALETWCR
jgi:hypothetical protein